MIDKALDYIGYFIKAAFINLFDKIKSLSRIEKIIFGTGALIMISIFLYFTTETYSACGCACCDETTKDWLPQFTIQPSTIIRQNEAIQKTGVCSYSTGCTNGTRYFYFKFLLFEPDGVNDVIAPQ